MADNGSNKIDLGKPQFASHSWVEPIIVVSIMVTSLVVNRRKNFKILGKNNGSVSDGFAAKSTEDVEANTMSFQDDSSEDQIRNAEYPPKRRNCGCVVVKTPNSSRFAKHIHSRILQKLPFLVEMFYWVLNYLFYSCTKAISQYLSPAGRDVVQLAQDHGTGILNFEHNSLFSIFFPIQESDFQAFFLNGHQNWMTFFNRIYSLVHIPGTVAFISWYYWAAPDFEKFSMVRRTMTLGNFIAFLVFCFFPCMPPRLLPESYNFHDTVRQEHAESVWVGGKMVNQLAAMPSLHFTYAFVIGATFIYHSGLNLQCLSRKRSLRSLLSTTVFLVLAIVYPLIVLSVIVATANHYWLDAVVAIFSVTFSFYCNRIWLVLLPLEDLLLWALRLEKPTPTTGSRYFRGAGQAKTDDEFEESEHQHLLDRYT